MGILRWIQAGNSLRLKLTLSVFMMTLPLVVMLLYNNFYSIQVVREQVAQSYKSSLNHSMNLIDKDLNNIDAYMNTIAGATSELSALSVADSDDDYFLTKAYLFNKLMKDIAMFHLIESFFVYVKNRADYMNVSSISLSLDETELIQNYIVDNLIRTRDFPLGTITKRWQYAEIGPNHYFIDIVQTGDVYIGAWVRSDALLSALQSLNVEDGSSVVIATDQNQPITNMEWIAEEGIELPSDSAEYILSGTNEQYLIVSSNSMRGSFKIHALIPDKSILKNLPYLQKLIWLITIVAIVFIPLGFYFMIHFFLVPVGRLLLAMKKIRNGDWGTRVDMKKTSREFQILGFSFNAMMDEIQRLRVNVYEEQINKQQEELQRLQLQINPHFFLNSLNIVYNLAKVKKYDVIMDMTMALIRYFRYLFRSNTRFVRLRDEIAHTKDYLEIQALRFPDKLDWEISIPDYLADLPVPPLILQIFVENSIKYAINTDRSTHIQVQAGYADENGSKALLQVRDSGKGFDENVLDDLNAGRSLYNDRGERTGIWNVQRRLKLLYQGEASIIFDNDPVSGGAVVKILLPADQAKEEQHEL